ncbi:MAG TPA: nuclear transport factor 2 family protein [Candidatus Sulfotelmatobacter sp.]|nr:nuclear transport factor 2 family protein [Candidatus Sulfotelmatobacter sp.]
MRVRLLFASAVAGALLFAVPSMQGQTNRSVPDHEKAKQELLEVENRWLHAEDNPDVQEEILAPDFVHVLPSGMITKKEQIEYLRKHRGVQEPKHFEDVRVRIYGNAGIVNGAVVRGEGVTLRRTLFTDVFVRDKGKWQAVNAQELTEKQGH